MEKRILSHAYEENFETSRTEASSSSEFLRQELYNLTKSSSFEQSMANKPIEDHPLQKYKARYETNPELHEDGYILTPTRVKGSSGISYESAVYLQDGKIAIREALRKRPEDDENAGIDYVFDDEQATGNTELGESLQLSDVAYGQINAAIEKYGKQFGVERIEDFNLTEIVVEDTYNPSTVATVNKWVHQGETKTFLKRSDDNPERSDDGYDEIRNTPFGKSSELLVRQRFPGKEISGFEITREESEEEEISLISFFVDDKPNA